MDKIAIYKEAMEKIASRAWKKHLGNLTEEGVNRLVNTGVLNYDKELKGLRRGTHAINGKSGTKLLRNPRQAAAAHIQQARTNAPELSLRLNDFVDGMKEQIKRSGPNTSLNISGTPNKAINGKKTYAYVRKGTYNKDIADNPQYKDFYDFERIPRRDRDAQKWVQAIFERHEADEGRVVRRIRKKDLYKNPSTEQDASKTQYFSHFNPKVMQAESANVALAPKSAKKIMANFRDETGEKSTLPIINGGVPYGSSAVYSKKAGRKAEKSIRKQTNDFLNNASQMAQEFTD